MELTPGKTAFVTGGANGIGAAVVRALAYKGVNVVSFDIDEKANIAHADLIYPVTCDCSKYEDIAQSFRLVLAQFGTVDILVNNVGGFQESSFLRQSYPAAMEGFEEMMRICAGSTYAFTQLAAPVMATEGKGTIVNVLTNHVHRDICRVSPAEHSYDAAKYAQFSLNMTMAAELHPHGIRVNAVDPAATDTRMLRDYLAVRGLPSNPRSVGKMTGTASLLSADNVAEAICNLLSWEDPAPVGKNFLLRFPEDCAALRNPIDREGEII